MQDRPEMTLEDFSVVCNACGGQAQIFREDNSSCGGSCCGPYESWPVFRCSNCKVEESAS